MPKEKQAWLIAFGTGESRLPEAWVDEAPKLLNEWPIKGGRTPGGIGGGDHLLYYAAGHKTLIGAGRVVGSVSSADIAMSIQTYLVVPRISFAPSWEILGVAPDAIEGKRAITLGDAQYQAGLDALVSVAWERFNSG